MNPDSNSQANSSASPVDDKSFFTINVIGALIVGLIVGFLIGAFYVKHTERTENDMVNVGDMDMNATTTSTTTTATNTVMLAGHPNSGNSEVTIADKRAGNAVTLSTVTLNRSYWVAVRDSSTDVASPYILGARRIQAGSYQNVSIALSRDTVAGKRYDIVLYKDNGGPFNYDESNLIEVNNGSPVLYTFGAI